MTGRPEPGSPGPPSPPWESLAAMLSASPDLMILCDRSGTLLAVSPSASRFWGRSPTELIGKGWNDLPLPPSTLRALEILREAVFATGRTLSDQISLTAGSTLLHCECIVAPILGRNCLIETVTVTFRDIGRGWVEASQRRRQEQYRLLAHNATDMISRHDPDGVYLYASPASRTLLGYEPEELVGRSAYEFIHPDDLGQVRSAHAALLETTEALVITFRVRRKEGTYLWFETSVRAVRDPAQGRVVEIQCGSRDVSRRHQAEQELRENRALLQAILDHTTAVIYIKDTHFRYILINRRYEMLFHVSAEWIAGRTDDELFPADKVAALRANDRMVLETGRALEFEELVPHGGQVHTYLSVKFPIRRPDGSVFAVGGISTDITQRKRDEEALQQQTEVLRLVLDSMAEAVLVADEQRQIYLFNPAAQRMFDLGRDDIGRPLGHRPAEIYHADGITPIPSEDLPLERSLRGEAVSDLEVCVRRPPPHEVLRGLVNGRPLLDREGRSRGAVIVYRDITERKKIEQQIRDQNTRLEETIRSEREAHEALREAESHLIQAEKLSSLGQMVAGVAHEINNPLAFVTNNVVVLKRDLDLILDLLQLYRSGDATLAEHRPDLFHRIQDHGERYDLSYALVNLHGLIHRSTEGLKRIQRIVEDLRTFARLDEGDYQEVNLNDGIVSTINIIHGRAKGQGVTLELDLAPLPLISCQASRINQVVLNLVANAVDASSSGNRVIVRTRAMADTVEIHVIDEGQGIPPAIRGKIFDPFFTTKPVGRGTGLGLSISFSIVHDHGGLITVESEPGKGSHFTVKLPARPPGRRPRESLNDGSPGPSSSR